MAAVALDGSVHVVQEPLDAGDRIPEDDPIAGVPVAEIRDAANQTGDRVPAKDGPNRSVGSQRVGPVTATETFFAVHLGKLAAQVTFKGTLGEFHNFWQHCTNYNMSI